MSNSNSSREVTEKKKKKNVWEEAGAEFYQESYPSGSGQPEENAVAKSSRCSIPLPSHTARKNSFGYHNRRRSTFGRTATVTTNTNAFTTYNSTNRLPTTHEVNAAALPDFADMTIPNERKRWLELHRIKSMPINMGAKKELKTQLTTIPMLKLKGTKRFKWNFQMLKEKFILKWTHCRRRNFLWENSLRDVEDHSGTFITRVLISIKWTVYFNSILFLLLLSFIILPHLLREDDTLATAGGNKSCPQNFSTSAKSQISASWAVEERNWKGQLATCCASLYAEKLLESRREEADVEESELTVLLRALNMSAWGDRRWGFPVSLTYGFYQSTKLKLPSILGGLYDLPLAYLVIPIAVFIFTLLSLLWQIRSAIREVALAREGEFYKFSNLIFAGWDHYTKTLPGANFRKRILKHEMRILLETEQEKVASESRKQKWLLITKRMLTNFIVLLILGGTGSVNFFIADYSLRSPPPCLSSNCTNETAVEIPRGKSGGLVVQFLPGISVALCNFFLLFILRQIGKLESYPHESEKALLLARALIGRLITVGSVAVKFYVALYCPKLEKTCTLCKDELEGRKDLCWEAEFGLQVLIILSVDLVFQVLLTLVFGYGRFLLGKILPCKGIGDQSFCVTRHSLDVLYIQSISWFFYFSPFLPLLILIYCLFVFYLKKFSLVILSKGVSETVRTTRSKAVYVTVRLIAITTVAVTLGFVLFEMEPSKGCGPFRTKNFPWEVVTDLDHRSATDAAVFLMSPGILIPLLLIITLLSYFYYSSAKANRRMVETLKHMLVLEGHDKQYLFARLNTVPEAPENGTLLGRSLGNLDDTNPSGSAKN